MNISDINKSVAGGIIPYNLLEEGGACNTGKVEFELLFPNGFSVGSQHDSDKGNNPELEYGTIDLIRTVCFYAHRAKFPTATYVRIYQQFERVNEARWDYVRGWRTFFSREYNLLFSVRKNSKYRRTCYLALREIVRIFNEANVPKG